MKSKPFLIAIAAFAVTATGVQAYQGTRIFEEAGLTKEQISAFETARELRESGDVNGARDALVKAGVDESVLQSVHKAAQKNREALKKAIEGNDYAAFREVAVDSPFAEKINSEADFQKLASAHTLRAKGDLKKANALLDELGIKFPKHGFHNKDHRNMDRDVLKELSAEQREALAVATKANDKEAVHAILKEAGFQRLEQHRKF